MPAVQSGAVYEMPSGIEEWDSPIPSGILGTLWMTSVLHGDAYPFDTFTADVQDFYKTFYGFEIDRRSSPSKNGPDAAEEGESR